MNHPSTAQLRIQLAAATTDVQRLRAARDLAHALYRHELSESLELARDICALANELGDAAAFADGLRLSAVAQMAFGRTATATSLLDDALARAQVCGDHRVHCRTLWASAKFHEDRCEFAEALKLYELSRHQALCAGDQLLASRVSAFTSLALHNMGHGEDALSVLQAALDALTAMGDDQGVALASTFLGQIYSSQGDKPGALTCFNAAVAIYDDLGDVVSAANARGQAGHTFLSAGDVAQALERFETAAAVMQKYQLAPAAAAWTGHAGIACATLKHFAIAAERFRAALESAIEYSERGLAMQWNFHLSAVHEKLGEFAEALAYSTDSLQIARDIDSPIMIAAVLANRSSLLSNLGHNREALEDASEAREIATTIGKPDVLAMATFNVGELLLTIDFEDADAARGVEMLKTAGDLAATIEFREVQLNVERTLARHYEVIGEWQMALDHTARAHHLELEIQTAEAHDRVRALEHAREVERLERERLVEQAEAEATRLRAEDLERELDHKQQQLASTAMSLAKQTELLGRFRNDLRSIMRGNSDLLDIVKQIREKLKELPCEAIDWAKFDAEFRQTYPEFQSKLAASCPELTKMEVKICSLLRVNLTSLEVAQLMCKSERSIEWHRLNIRRKLGLTRDQDVYAALAAIR